MSPKSLLRSPAATSQLDDLATGGFQRIIPDASVAPKKARRSCSARARSTTTSPPGAASSSATTSRSSASSSSTRCDADLLREVLAPYKNGTPLVWVQEEPWNMGAWYSMRARLPELIARSLPAELRLASGERQPCDRLDGRPQDRTSPSGRTRARVVGARSRATLTKLPIPRGPQRTPERTATRVGLGAGRFTTRLLCAISLAAWHEVVLHPGSHPSSPLETRLFSRAYSIDSDRVRRASS